METRRGYLKIIGGIGATCAFPFPADELYAQEDHPHTHDGSHYTAPVVAPFEPKFFTAAEGLVVSRIADLIIPQTDTPGAVAAGVPQYIDTVAAKSPEQQKLFREGIAWLNAHSNESHQKAFMDLPEEQQIGLLTVLSDASDAGDTSREGVAFFRTMKNLTADGYYTSYAGLVQELGYKGNQALPAFEGCTHEH